MSDKVEEAWAELSSVGVVERGRAAELQRKPVMPLSCDGAAQQVSVDGAMIRVRGGEWAEVKTVAGLAPD